MGAMVWIFATLLLVWGLVLLGRRLRRGPVPIDAAPVDPGGPDPEYEVAIGDELDLHGVPPPEVDSLVDAFIEVSVAQHRGTVRIVHGKGTGTLRARVRARLARHPDVVAFGDAPSPGGGWGATVVRLGPPRAEVAPGDPGIIG